MGKQTTRAGCHQNQWMGHVVMRWPKPELHGGGSSTFASPALICTRRQTIRKILESKTQCMRRYKYTKQSCLTKHTLPPSPDIFSFFLFFFFFLFSFFFFAEYTESVSPLKLQRRENRLGRLGMANGGIQCPHT